MLRGQSIERVARRMLSGNITRGPIRIGTLFELTRGANDDLTPVLRGLVTSLQEYPRDDVPPALRAWAGLEKEVVWVGMGPVIHLYDKAAHAEQMAAEIPPDEVVDLFGKA